MKISELNPEGAYIALQFVDPLCLSDIDLVWQTSPAVQYPFVVHITDQLLTLLSQKEAQHIHGHIELVFHFSKSFLYSLSLCILATCMDHNILGSSCKLRNPM